MLHNTIKLTWRKLVRSQLSSSIMLASLVVGYIGLVNAMHQREILNIVAAFIVLTVGASSGRFIHKSKELNLYKIFGATPKIFWKPLAIQSLMITIIIVFLSLAMMGAISTHPLHGESVFLHVFAALILYLVCWITYMYFFKIVKTSISNNC